MNVSGPRYTELLRAERDLQARINRDAIAEFTETFVHNLGVLAALTPYARWPKEFKAAFDAIPGCSTAKHIYKDLLPKEAA